MTLSDIHPRAALEQLESGSWIVTRPTDDGGVVLGSGRTKEEAMRNAMEGK